MIIALSRSAPPGGTKLQEFYGGLSISTTSELAFAECKRLGLSYDGAPVGRAGAAALKTIYPFVMSIEAAKAYKAFEMFSTCLNQPTLLDRVCGACLKLSGKNVATAIGVFTVALEALRVSLQVGNTDPRKVGKVRYKVGFAHMAFKRNSLQDFLGAQLSAASLGADVIPVMRDTIYPTLRSPQILLTSYATPVLYENLSEADSGAAYQLPAESQGLENITNARYAEARQKWPRVAQEYADLLYNTGVGRYDEELLGLALKDAESTGIRPSWENI